MRKSHRTITATRSQEDKQSKASLCLPHQDDCKARKDTKQYTKKKHGTNRESHNESNN